MIAVTRLDGTTLIVNSDQIAWIEHNPDTVLSLANGEKLIVRESADEVVERVTAYRRAISGVVVPVARADLTIVGRPEGDAR